MSTALAHDTVPIHLPASEPETSRPFRLVPSAAPRRRSALGFALVAMLGIAVVIVAQLLMSVVVSQNAYEIDRLTAAQVVLDRSLQTANEAIDRVESPQYLATKAQEIGMVQNGSPVFLRLSDGAVLGEPTSSVAGATAATTVVPNSLLDTATSGTPNGATGVGGAATVPLTNGLPTPVTH